MDIGRIITKAWEAFWNHKILWVFGILNLAVGAIIGIWYNLQYDVEKLINISPTEIPFSEDMISIFNWGVENTALFVILIVLVVFIFLGLNLFLSAFCTTALIKGALLVDQGAEKLSFGEVAASTGPYFWRIVGLNALLGVSSMGLVMVLFLILLVFGVLTAGIAMLCIFPLFCLMIPFGWFLTIVVTQANVAIVADDLSIKDRVVYAWKLVTKQIGPFVLVWLIVMVISMVVSFVSSAPAMIASIPMYGKMFSPEYLNEPTLLIDSLSNQTIWTAIWMPVQYVLLGIFSAFSMSIWVQTYLAARENGTVEPQAEPEIEDPEILEQTT